VRESANGLLATGVVMTPWGPWGIAASARGIVQIELRGSTDGAAPDQGSPAARALLAKAQEQLRAYLAGERRPFDLPMEPAPATDFQRRVWAACAQVPYGATATYAELAQTVGSPKGARAVGQALGANPLPVLVPCHRILSSDGTLGGYGGGLAMKRGLLTLEGVTLQA